MSVKRVVWVWMLVSLVPMTRASGQPHEMGTAFTYQGQLEDDGSPGSGLYDFEFKLCDDPVAACTLATTTAEDQQVDEGLFTVVIDFGADVFNGQARWLEMGVRPGASVDPHTTLSPRQELTPAPYAKRAGNGVGPPSGVNVNTTTGQVGIGTADPAYSLEIAANSDPQLSVRSERSFGTTSGIRIRGARSGDTETDIAYIELRDLDDNEGPYPGTDFVMGKIGGGMQDPTGQTGNLRFSTNEGAGPVERVRIDSVGNVGIGTDSPSEKLEVVGNVEATGNIHADGTITSGSSITIDGVNDRIECPTTMEFHVGGARVLRMEPNATSPNVIAGHWENWLTDGVYGATIGGGGHTGGPNRAFDYYCTVGGGTGNVAGIDNGHVHLESGATVAGGSSNTATRAYSTVGGGEGNTVVGSHGTVGGGDGNTATENATVAGGYGNSANGYTSVIGGGMNNVTALQYTTVGGGNYNSATQLSATVAGGAYNTANRGSATVGGGGSNTAGGYAATVPGGSSNTAEGDFSFAAGRRAKANHHGTFVWADSEDNDFPSTSDNTFLIRASGGVGIGTNAPTEQLDVDGNIHASGTITSGSSITIDGVNDRIECPTTMEFHVGGARVLRMEPNATSPNVIGGHADNEVTSTMAGGTIGGGGSSVSPNRVEADYGTVGGGEGNTAGGEHATVCGGTGNTAEYSDSTVGGGDRNTATQRATVAGGYGNNAYGHASFIGGGYNNETALQYTTIAGGYHNTATRMNATVAGGSTNRATGGGAAVGGGGGNTAGGSGATVPGGYSNSASGDYSFAAGRRAKVRDAVEAGEDPETCSTDCGDEGTFVWADSTNADFQSTGPDQFLIRASGGVGIGTNAPANLLTVNGDADFTGSVGIGTDAPIAPLDVRHTNAGIPSIVTGGSADYATVSYQNMTFGHWDGTTYEARIWISPTGNVGIGRFAGTNKLEVEGTASKTAAGDWASNSDKRIKTEITRVANALDTIDRLRPVQFKYTDDYRAKHPSIEDKHYLNFVAQEYQEVFPDFVKDSGEDGLLQIDTHPASIYAVAAVQELHKIVREKDVEIATQQRQIAELASRLAALEQLVNQVDAGQRGGGR